MSFLVASLNIVLIACLAWWLSRRTAGDHMAIFWTALAARLGAGLLLGVVYYYHYSVGDTIWFFNDAVRLSEVAKHDPSSFLGASWSGIPPIELSSREPRSFFFTVLLTLANLATGNNYWISSLWFSFFSFCGTWYLLTRIATFLPPVHKAAWIAFLFLPSVVFWSSGIIKESVGFGALCLLAGVLVGLMNDRRLTWYESVAVAISLWLLLGLKYYWAAVFLPAAATSLLVHWFIEKRMRPAQTVALWFVVFFVLCGLASFTHPNFYFERFLDVIRQNHDAFVAISKPGNLIHFSREVSDWGDVVINAPWALFSGLFRPLPLGPDSWTGYFAAAENALLFAFALTRLIRLGPISSGHRLMLLSLLAYVSLLCIFLALSTPNLGTLSRYRIGFLPFFALLVLHNHPIFTSRWQSLRKLGQ